MTFEGHRKAQEARMEQRCHGWPGAVDAGAEDLEGVAEDHDADAAGPSIVIARWLGMVIMVDPRDAGL